MTEEELKRQTEREIRWRIGFRLLPWGLLILIICIGLLKDCVRSRDPIDDSINRSQEVVRHLEVCDSTRNGSRVVYVTTPCRNEGTVGGDPPPSIVESGILQTPRQCGIPLRRQPAPNGHLRFCGIRS